MMDRKTTRNMLSSYTNKVGIQCICWFYSQGICIETFCLGVVECKDWENTTVRSRSILPPVLWERHDCVQEEISICRLVFCV